MVSITSNKLTKYFGKIVALYNVSFNASGRIIAVVGPNGSGKTTLLSIIAGLRYPSKGSLLINGFEPYKRRDSALKIISMNFGNPLHNTSVNIGRLIKIAIRECPNGDQLPSILRDLGLSIPWNKKFNEISSGQSQLITLVTTLFCNKASLAILDEPLSHLDIHYRAEMLSIMRERGNIIFTTHILEEAETIADYIVVLSNGSLVWHGKVDKLYNSNIYEIFPNRQKIIYVKNTLQDKIIADLGVSIAIKAPSIELLDKLFKEGLIVGYRRAGLRMIIHEQYKSRVQSVH